MNPFLIPKIINININEMSVVIPPINSIVTLEFPLLIIPNLKIKYPTRFKIVISHQPRLFRCIFLFSLLAETQEAPVSDGLRHPYKFPCMTGKDALTRACSSLPVFFAMPYKGLGNLTVIIFYIFSSN